MSSEGTTRDVLVIDFDRDKVLTSNRWEIGTGELSVSMLIDFNRLGSRRSFDSDLKILGFYVVRTGYLKVPKAVDLNSF